MVQDLRLKNQYLKQEEEKRKTAQHQGLISCSWSAEATRIVFELIAESGSPEGYRENFFTGDKKTHLITTIVERISENIGSSQADEFSRFFNSGSSEYDNPEFVVIRQILACSLTKILFQTAHDPESVLMLADGWHSLWALHDVLEICLHSNEIAMPEKNMLCLEDEPDLKKHFIQICEKLLQPLLDNPELGIIHGEGYNFSLWLKEWHLKKNIDQYWQLRGGYWSMHSIRLSLMNLLLPEGLEQYACLASKVTTPGQLNQILYSNTIVTDPEIIAGLIEKAGSVVDTENHWNGRCFAPELLEVAQRYAASLLECADENEKAEFEKDVRCFFKCISAKLKARPDGTLLSTSFIEYLLLCLNNNAYQGEPRPEALAGIRFLEELIQAFRERIEPETVRRKIDYAAIDLFKKRGVIAQKTPSIDLIALIRLKLFSPPESEEEFQMFIDAFHCILASQTKLLLTNESQQRLLSNNQLHIAMLYLRYLNPVEAWQETWAYLAEIRYKYTQDLYGDNHFEFGGRIRYVLSIGMAILNFLSDKDETGILPAHYFDMSKMLWEKLNDMLLIDNAVHLQFYKRMMSRWGQITIRVFRDYCNVNTAEAICQQLQPKVESITHYPEVAYYMADEVLGQLGDAEYYELLQNDDVEQFFKNIYELIAQYYDKMPLIKFSYAERRVYKSVVQRLKMLKSQYDPKRIKDI